MNGNTFAINKNQNEIDSYNSTYLEEVSDFSTNQDESIYSNFEYSLNEVTPVINDVTKEKQFVFEDDIYTVVYEEQSEEFGTIYHVVKNNSDKDEYTLWDVADIIMAGASWATFFKEPSFASFGLSVLDTVSCEPFIPSTAYVRKGGKTFIDSVKWSKHIIANPSIKREILKKLICKEAGNPKNVSKVLFNYPSRKTIPSRVSYPITIRKEKKLTQRQVAEQLGVVESCYANWEQGRTEPDISTLRRLSLIFEVSIDYLLSLEDDFGVRVAGIDNSDTPATAEERKLLADYRALPEELRALIREQMALFTKAEGIFTEKK